MLKLGIQNVIHLKISGDSNFSKSLMFTRGDILMCTLSPIIFITIAILVWTVKMSIGPSRVKSSRERIQSPCLITNKDNKSGW
jgi:uncharacterized membrane protein